MTDLHVAGSPELCRHAARQLRDAQQTYERVASELVEIADESSAAWHGAAADAYRLALSEQRARAESLALVSRELAAGLDLLADGLDAARADMARARAALHAAGVPFTGDNLPPPFVLVAAAPDPDAALAAYDRARAFVTLARTVESSAQQAWYVAVSGALRELGSGRPPVVIDEARHWGPVSGFQLVPGLDRLDDWLPSIPDLPPIPVPFGPMPGVDLRDLTSMLQSAAGDSNPVLAGSREFLEQFLEDSRREDLGLVERLARAGIVGGLTYAGGLGAGVACGRFAPKIVPVCTKAGVSGGSWLGNWLVDRADAR